jgi:ADP-heptose:LPS heptosyltransferase
LDARFAQNEWRLVQAGRNSPAAAAELARAIAREFMENFFFLGRSRFRYIDLLCEMALHPEPVIYRAGVQSLYGTVVEGLCDHFSEQGVRTCNQVLLRILDRVSSHAQGSDLAALLGQFGVHGPALLNRYERNRRALPVPESLRRQVRKVVVLSRVSAGADIVITSVILQRVEAAFPEAQTVLLGPAHLADFFACGHRRWLQLEYKRQGNLFERLQGWPEIVRLISRESMGLGENSLVIFDPDTRLSQLGLLPLTDEFRTCYFCSRSCQSCGQDSSLPELTNSWLDQLLGEQPHRHPAVFLAQEKLFAAKSFGDRLRQAGVRRVMVVNLGVGEDQRKRIAGNFEEELLVAALQMQEGTVIVLDSGGDSEEKERIGRLLRILQAGAIPVDFATEEELTRKEAPFNHGVIGFRGSLGGLAGLLAAADGYLGYDSCGQHLASAIGVPAVIIFAGAPNPRFYDRWRSRAPSTITVPINETELPRSIREELVIRIIGKLSEIVR